MTGNDRGPAVEPRDNPVHRGTPWRTERSAVRFCRTCRGIAAAEFDGVPVDGTAIPIENDGGLHEVTIVLGPGLRVRAFLNVPQPADASGQHRTVEGHR